MYVANGFDRTYSTEARAIAAAAALTEPMEHELGTFHVVIAAAPGGRFAPVFVLTDEQVMVAAAIARKGFKVYRGLRRHWQ